MRPFKALTGLRPVCFFLPAFAVLLLPILLTPCWHALVNRIERQVKNDLSSQAEFPSSVLQSEFANKAEFLRPLNSSATNLARFLGSSVGEAALSFSEIETRVAPVLFQAFSTIPYLTQISYIGSDGLFFSYYTDGSQTLSMYSNSSSFVHDSSTAPNVGNNYVWYVQSVNNETGKLHGEAIEVPPLNMKNKIWFQEALNSTHGSASLETGWNSAQVPVFLNSARINGGSSVLSLGFPVKALTSIFTDIDLRGGRLDILAVQDRKVLFQGIPNTHLVLSGSVVSVQLIKPNGDQIGIGNISCNLKDGTPSASALNIQETEYTFYCLPLDIVGVQSVSVLAYPENGLVRLVHKSRKVAMLLLIVLIATLVIFLSSFVFTIVRAAKREMHLCANLIKQMEATQQAERKSMNKILAFASASHDVRAALAGITGLIEMCYDDVAPGTELDTNLRQMDTCANDLLGILNSILDTSKIEAGKMPLEEEEFDLEKLLEDVADLYHPVGIRKGVDVVLDPCDGSTKRFSQVKGDRGKLKQILCNLLSNAVKFTSEGHVTIRAWVRKPGLQNSINASKQNCLPCFLYKSSKAYNDFEAVDTAQHDPNTMDFVFEVDDTGKGIPKDKQDSVFENYVQVKETALGQEGTGLGLGIVQSLVRLMHGDIGIVDKDVGEKGTCFRFNALLTISETASSDNAKAEDLEMGGVTYLSGSISPVPSPQMTVRTPSPKSTVLTSSPKMKASHVVLLIQSNGRRKMLRRFMSNLGMNVSVVKQWEHLSSTLEKIKNRQSPSHHNSIKSDLSSPSDNLSRSASNDSIAAEKDVPWSTMGGSDYIPSIFKRTNLRLASNFILTVIDASAGPLPEICRIVAEFRRGLQNTCCKAVWLDKPMMRSFNLKRNDEDIMIDPNDIIISKPFHGSRLYEVVRLLPEFGGKMPQAGKLPRDPSSSRSHLYAELQDHRSSSEIQGKKVLSQTENRSNVWPKSRRHRSHENPPREQEIQECGDPSNEFLLRGKTILVVEDNALIRRLTVSQLAKLGATVEVCENGQEALELVSKGLTDQRKAGASMSLPYDYILMDCEMPILNGYKAAEEIRKMEKHFGVHTPIIALTAHTDEEAKKTIEAGMDVYIGKPLKREHLLEAIRYIENK
ncbi:histidine kinase CKI1 [Juglans microcarpa x Juglans regia]|uniref:histidine kinase CKI1 n=1 Tax=Juglans microcarpa x Juglans regia TaxID=2249226 RepID=UPI001B7F0EED|nr:histidine kinase CKI1 [Juglans microcarpa x Juglans regia]